MHDGEILAGDIGGTNARFALARRGDGVIVLSDVWKRPGADYPSFEAALDAYFVSLGRKPVLAGACFGLAGPVSGGRVELLHRGWMVDAQALRAKLGVADVLLVNDFFAMARAAPELDVPDAPVLFAGESDPDAAIAVGGPGTGFGVAIVRRYTPNAGEAGWIVVGGEGGHQAFAPETDLEFRIAEILRARHGYVSNEHVASGSGFESTLDALAQAMGTSSPGWSEAELMTRAKAGDELGVAMCRLRARTVMTAMGNMALLSNATGGVFLAGGVTTRITQWLGEDDARDRFYKRGPRTGLVSRIPIRLIAAETAPLIGAARLWLDQSKRGWL